MVCLMINTPNKKVKVMKLHQSHNILERVDHIWVTWKGILEPKCNWKIHSTTEINFMSSRNRDESHPMNSMRDNIEIMISNNTNEIIN